MKKHIMKLLLIGLVLLSLGFFECALPQNGHGSTAGADSAQARGLSPYRGSSWKVPVGRYAHGAAGFYGASGEAGAFGEESYLESEYQDWKDHYITSDGANGYLRVKRDYATYFDTVSEGIGYGMLLAVYFDDKATFDGLYRYATVHANSNGLMHWKVDRYGNNVCEMPDLSAPAGEFIRIPSVGDIDVTEVSAYTGEQLPQWPDTMKRSPTSAADADLDMAAALIFAYARWGDSDPRGQGIVYSYYARNMLRAILENDTYLDTINGRLIIGAGSGGWGSWGGPSGWNPSYATLAWFPIFEAFMTRHDPTYQTGQWNRIYADMAYLIYQVDTHNGAHGLLPDWVNTMDPNNPVQSLETSDRGPLPYNCYYDAVRVPWRMSLAASWYGWHEDRYLPHNLKLFIESQGGLANIKDGYTPNGGPFDLAYADWNNVYDGYYDPSLGRNFDGHYCRSPRPAIPTILNARGQPVVRGGLGPSPTFTAMFATVCLTSIGLSDSDCQAWYEMVKASKEPYYNDDEHPFNYYGNTLRLFSLLYLSGNMKNLYTCSWKEMLHVNGRLRGTQSGYYVIKNRKYGTYLARQSGGNGVYLKKDFMERLGSNALWRLVDDDNDGLFELKNLGLEAEGSAYCYLNCTAGTLNNSQLSFNRSNNTTALWRLYDNSGGNTLFVINPSRNTSYRIYANSPISQIINRSTGGGKYWQIIKYD